MRFKSPEDVIKKIECVDPSKEEGMPTDVGSNFEDLFDAIGQSMVVRKGSCYVDVSEEALYGNPVMVTELTPAVSAAQFIDAINATQLSFWPLAVPDSSNLVFITRTDAVHEVLLKRLAKRG